MEADLFDLDGRVFDLVSSTASRVDHEGPTRFHYHEAVGVVWGEYAGDTVALGRFVGTRTGGRLDVRFVHALVAGGIVSGAATSRIETAQEGLHLVEEFEVDGRTQASVCAEVSKR